MEPEILQTITVTSFAPASILVVWKVLIPLVNLFIARMNKTDTSADARLCKLEENDLHEIKGDIVEIKTRMEYLSREFADVKTKVAVLESKVK